MVSLPSLLLCIPLALVLWGIPGWFLARGLGQGRTAALALAPALGWATQTPAALAVAHLFGLSPVVIIGSTALLSLCALALPRASAGGRFPLLALVVAGLLALVPMLGVLPKMMPDGAIALASPIYDHAKIILIDEIAQNVTVPPANPVFGAGGAAGTVAYYYLWHFGAAELALLSGAHGWAADAAATWFTGFAALALVAGLAFRLRPGSSAPFLSLLAASAGSLRPVLAALFGGARVDLALEPASGLAGLLYQTSWSPHHVASATACVIAVLLMARLRAGSGAGQGAVLAAMIGLTAAAAFGSSLWVGGVTFALAGTAAALVVAFSGPTKGRLRFLATLAGAALVALALVAPLLMAQIHAAATRGGGTPVQLTPLPVLGPGWPDAARAVLDPLAYWLVLLPVEFPGIVFAGVAGLALVFAGRMGGRAARQIAHPLAALAVAALAVSATLQSTAGENNDLGWRAVLPAVLVLAAFAGAALAEALSMALLWAMQTRRAREGRVLLAAGLALVALGLPDTIALGHRNITGEPSADGRVFAGDPALWRAVRRAVGPEVRIASNPARLEKLTPWPINLSWALLSRRRSCFGGQEMALAFAPLSASERVDAAMLFDRVFAGTGTAEDVATLRRTLGCGAIVVTAQDGAWSADPFALSPLYRLAEEEDGRWRIYVASTVAR
ncbi:hypothetical protein [Xanthobacter sp. 91]|uniref:hypothetical protein n=1 Tax=Xanthobacter sp. 91 TaxID=1117244 RepID=UPI0012DE858A|nr:hypothetical protein [Xanthobacter sp. 91]